MPYNCRLEFRDVAQPGRVLVWGTSGRRFKSCHPDLRSRVSIFWRPFFCEKNTPDFGLAVSPYDRVLYGLCASNMMKVLWAYGLLCQ